jgi:hypothetical protein
LLNNNERTVENWMSAKNWPQACIYHQTKINTTVKKSAFKFSRLLTWIYQRESTPISRWRNSEHSCAFLWLYEVVTSGNSEWGDKYKPAANFLPTRRYLRTRKLILHGHIQCLKFFWASKILDWTNMHINTKIKYPPSLIIFLEVSIWEPDN